MNCNNKDHYYNILAMGECTCGIQHDLTLKELIEKKDREQRFNQLQENCRSLPPEAFDVNEEH